jgi:hypothetical protein
MKPTLSTAIGRWASVGPYYAMFPIDFAFKIVKKHSKRGDSVLDPFAGRASSIYAAAALGRVGVGIEINPVGWVYGAAKLNPASKQRVLSRIIEIGEFAKEKNSLSLSDLPEFFSHCYHPQVLAYLLTAREKLKWKTSKTDITLMALILIYLHGKVGQSLSNQMRQAKAMAPDYSVRWWKEHKMIAPRVDTVDFLSKRVEWRYAKGTPNFNDSEVIFGDSTKKLNQVESEKFKLLLTSPPYYGITNYHYDQWLRLWMLGGSASPVRVEGNWKGRFNSMPKYKELLTDVFEKSSSLMARNSVVYVRTDAREFTRETTVQVLKDCFPNKRIRQVPVPLKKKTQTALYGDKSSKPGEIDIILN